MKKLLFICIAALAVLASCNDYETYGDKKEKERNAISKFISDYQIVVIDEDQFILQGYTTEERCLHADSPSWLWREAQGW